MGGLLGLRPGLGPTTLDRIYEYITTACVCAKFHPVTRHRGTTLTPSSPPSRNIRISDHPPPSVRDLAVAPRSLLGFRGWFSSLSSARAAKSSVGCSDHASNPPVEHPAVGNENGKGRGGMAKERRTMEGWNCAVRGDHAWLPLRACRCQTTDRHPPRMSDTASSHPPAASVVSAPSLPAQPPATPRSVSLFSRAQRALVNFPRTESRTQGSECRLCFYFPNPNLQ